MMHKKLINDIYWQVGIDLSGAHGTVNMVKVWCRVLSVLLVEKMQSYIYVND